MKMNKILLAAMGMALLGVGLNANAAKSSGTISPSLTIASSCTVNTGGVSGIFTPQVSGSVANTIPMAGGTLAVTCPGLTYSIGANFGLNPLGTTIRRMKFGTTYIQYALGIASAGGTALVANVPAVAAAGWSDLGLAAKDVTVIAGGYANTMTSGSIATLSAAGSATDTFTITGATTVALTGAEAAGTYTDTVTVTVAW